MTRTALCLLAMLSLLPTAAAQWSAEDARGDASPIVANEWADLVAGALDADSARIELARATILPLGTAYLAVYAVEGEPTYCVAVQDRALNFLTGGWDEATMRPTEDVERADGSFTPGSPARIELADCRQPDAASEVRFLAIDVKTFPLGAPSTVLDTMDAIAPAAIVETSAASTPSAGPAASEPEASMRAVPWGAGLAIGALVGAAARSWRGRA